MVSFRPLPWDYGVRNLFRRPARSLLTFVALSLAVFLIIVVISFIRGLSVSLAISGDPSVVLVHSLGAAENIENSTMPGNARDLLRASIKPIQTRNGHSYVSPELYLGTEVKLDGRNVPSMGLVRGVTPEAALVHKQFQIIAGHWPGPGEILVGKLAATKLGGQAAQLEIGQVVEMEGRSWTVAGEFTAGASALESEIWCLLEDLQAATQRQDVTIVAMALYSAADLPVVDEFCKERLDLEWQATPEVAYYASLQKHYRPVHLVSWLIVVLMCCAGTFAGLNTMYGAVVGRVRELAALQTIGFLRRAIFLSLVQEAVVLSCAATLVASGTAVILLHGMRVRFTMGAFSLRVDHVAISTGLIAGVLIGVLGAIPPAVRAMRMSVADALKAI